MKLKGLTALALAAAVLFVLLAGCKAGPDAPANVTADGASVGQPEANHTIYAPQRLGVDFDERVLDAAAANPLARQIFAYADGRVYLERNSDIRENGELVGQRLSIVSVDMDGGDERVAWTHETAFEPNGRVQTFESVSQYAVDDGGNLWIVMVFETQDRTDELEPRSETRVELVKCDAEGRRLAACDLDSVREGLRAISGMALDSAGNVYLKCMQVDGVPAVHVFDGETAEYICRGSFDVNTSDVIRTPAGDMVCYAVVPDATGTTVGRHGFIKYSLAGDTLMETLVDYSGKQNVSQTFGGFGEWDVCIFDRAANALFGYNLDTGREARLVSFTESGIALPENPVLSAIVLPLGGVIRLADGEFLVSLAAEGLYRLAPDPYKDMSGKVMLTLGLLFPDHSVADAVRTFNTKSETVHIELRDYSENATIRDVAEIITQLDMDILRGEAPDLLNLKLVAPNKYINKGLLADLTEFLDNDPSVSRADLFENVLALTQTDGKQYHIITQFLPMTLVGKASVFGDSSEMTPEKVSVVLAQYPQAQLLAEYTAAEWISICTALLHDELIDWDAGTCDFNNADFITVLEMARRAPTRKLSLEQAETAAEFAAFNEAYAQRIAKDEVLFSFGVLTELRSARTFAELYGNDAAFLGFPSADGGQNVINPMCDFAIMETSAHKAEAWEFLSMLLRDDYRSAMKVGTSINRDSFEKRAAAEMVPLIDRDYTNMAVIGQSSPVASYAWIVRSADEVRGPMYANYHLTAEEISIVRQAIESATRLSSIDTQVANIVAEETDVFLKGSRTAEETARVIQSRVSLYVGESR